MAGHRFEPAHQLPVRRELALAWTSARPAPAGRAVSWMTAQRLTPSTHFRAESGPNHGSARLATPASAWGADDPSRHLDARLGPSENCEHAMVRDCRGVSPRPP